MFSRRSIFRSTRAGILACGWWCVTAAGAQSLVQEGTAPEAEAEEEEGFLAGSLLPDGSILKNVVIPSYDVALNLAATVTATELTIVNRRKMEAQELLIRFFSPDRQPDGRIEMSRASIRRVGKVFRFLSSKEPVSFVSDDLKVDGSALIYDIQDNRGFLHGPVTAVATTTDLKTSMNATPAHRALAAGALLMAAAPAQETAPAAPAATTAERFAEARLSQAELDRLAADKASRAPQHRTATTEAGTDLAEVKAKSEDARITMNGFLQAASLASKLAAPAPETLPDVPRPEALEDPKDTVIKSKDGAYFDSQEGLLIFLGDVTVKNPELDLSGASEVKVFMEPEKKEETAAVDPDAPPKPPPTPEQLERMKAAKAAQNVQPTPEQLEKMKAAKAAKLADDLKKTAKADQGGEGGKFGDVKRMVATGPAVRIRYQSDKPDADPIKASAHTVVYDFEKQTILLQGGSPWVDIDGQIFRALGREAYILVYTDDGELTKVFTFNDEFAGNIRTPEKDDEKKQQKPKQEQPNR